MSDIGDVARAVEVIGKIVFTELNPTKQRRIQESYDKNQDKIVRFKNALLDSDIGTCRALWNICMPIIPVDLHAADIDQLSKLDIGKINGWEWLGQFSCAISAEFLKDVRSILAESDPVNT